MILNTCVSSDEHSGGRTCESLMFKTWSFGDFSVHFRISDHCTNFNKQCRLQSGEKKGN